MITHNKYTIGKEISGLNWLRGIAAILVLMSHTRAFFYTDFKDYSETPTFFVKFFYLITGLGHPAVMIFFVLSGFLVAGSVDRQWQQNIWNVKKYLVARVIRLWVVLFPCLLITLSLDQIGYHFFNPSFYEGILNSSINIAPSYFVDWSISSFIGNITFLQTIIFPVYGSNGPFWSLANEFWYYILFPLGIYISRSKNKVVSFSSSIILLILCFFIGTKILALFPVWLFGFLAFWLFGLEVKIKNDLPIYKK